MYAALFSSSLRALSMAQLNMKNQRVLLSEDQIKKEIEDTTDLICFHCGMYETIDIKGERNTTPFNCSLCDLLEPLNFDEQQISLYTTTSTTQTQATYYIHFSHPETIVTTIID